MHMVSVAARVTLPARLHGSLGRASIVFCHCLIMLRLGW